jgi:competence protein ComEC
LPDRRIDLLVLTHGDFDHVGSVPHLVARLPVRRAVLPAELRTTEIALLLSQQGASLSFLAAGEQRHLTPHLQVVRPNVDSDSRNDHSMWVRVDLGSFQVLLSGDPLEAGVHAYLAGVRPEPCDVIVLPHHGREHGAIEELLRTVQPKLALVSCPRQDGISAQAVVARKLGIPTLHTGLRGSLQVDATDPPVVHTQQPLLIRTEPGSDTK